MRIVIASCTVTYSGRGDTQLTEAVRAIILKADGAISIHSDQGTKPLNYMGKGSTHTITEIDDHTVWVFDTRKESLEIHLHQILADTDHPLSEVEPGLIRDGTEQQLQTWLASNPEELGVGFSLIGREYPTGAGPVDLMTYGPDGEPVAVEVKRVSTTASVYQIKRYVDALNESGTFDEPVQGVIAALDFRPKVLELAAKRGISCVLISRDFYRTTTQTPTEQSSTEQ